jgi:hypothetical protein
MFWEAELTRLTRRKQELAAECDLARARVVTRTEVLARKLAWVEAAHAWLHRAQPLLLVGAPLAGLFLGKRLPRLARWSAFAAPLLRVGRAFLQWRRTSPRAGNR